MQTARATKALRLPESMAAPILLTPGLLEQGPDQVKPEVIAAEDVRATLERLFLENPFQRSPQLRAFLAYVVEMTLAGQGGLLKSYSIATQALGRPVDFDPATDAIVRVEAKRLRQVLAGIYADPACDLPIRIDIPVGRYEPVFRIAASMEEPEELASHPAEHTVAGSRAGRSRASVESDRRLREALDAARVIAWEFDPTTGLVTHSDHARSVLGIGPGPAPDFHALIHPDDQARVVSAFDAALRAAGGPLEQTFRILRPDGRCVQVLARGDVVKPYGNEGVRLAGILIELTLS